MNIHKFFYTFFILSALFVGAHTTQAFTVSTNSVSVIQGQSAYVSLSSSSGVSVSSNAPAIFSASLSGNQVTIVGSSVGSGTLTLCITGDGCQTIAVTVTTNTPVTTTTNSNPLTFSSGTTLTMQAGSSQTVTLSGAGSYRLQNNSTSNVVSASLGGNSLFLMASEDGGDNITVCDGANSCGVLFVTVQGTPAVSNTPPAIISFAVSSSGSGTSFLQSGSSLLISFNTSLPIASGSVRIGNSIMNPAGSGTGPYTVNYGVSGNESTPLPVTISVSDNNGNASSFAFALGQLGAQSTVTTPPTTVTNPTTSTNANPIFLYKFNSSLSFGMTSVDVLALQKRLAAEGLLTATPNGYFGFQTEAAVKAYQKAHGISQLGIVGPSTRAALNGN